MKLAITLPIYFSVEKYIFILVPVTPFPCTEKHSSRNLTQLLSVLRHMWRGRKKPG